MMEEHFIRLLSSQLKGFKKTGSAYNFRCPYCLDSKFKKSKQRGYLFQRDGNWIYYCHNCNASSGFKYFLKAQNEGLYQDYVLENYSNNEYEKPKPIKKAVSTADTYFKKLTKISSLNPFHPAKKYILSRQIPTDFHHKLFYCQKFKSFTNLLIPDKFDDLTHDEPRIIIPVYRNNKLVGYQGRSIGKSDIRYITIVLDEDAAPLIFGYDDVEWNAKHYIFEGVFDAIFVPNSLAVCGSGLLKAVQRLNKPKNYSILIFDNEPRNEHNVSQMKRAVKEGYRICVFPDSFGSKDVNDFILSVVGEQEFVQTEKVRQLGHEVKMIIDQNIYHGLNAELKLAEWSRA